ncbi:energy transducer TonB [Spirosoma endbachense]|uniref:TonB family protein n=1 Tax=Spirosoma endbachense TaxID=2666025 RepID=A0A6P1VPM7_9BACT|nr:energy transducer TonB [Spirosoma endbachense]QHV94574.1 TonB family protein [Spirosoma endbachense]
MRTPVLIIVLLATFWLPLQAQTVQTDSSSTPDHLIYTVVQQQPEFPGGMSKLGQYISDNLRYPKAAQVAGLAGRVFIRFLITKQGAIEGVKVLKGVSPEIDAEAIRMVATMPNWVPGKVDGQAVDCFYNLPINFSVR